MYIYYVYAYLREDGTPYYIGKGKNKRAFSQYHNSKPPKDLSRIVFLESGLSNVGACALERRYILWYGRKDLKTGILRNLTEGGEGNTGSRSKEWRKNHSIKMTGKMQSPETIEKLKRIDRSYMKTEEYRRKISDAKKNKPNIKLQGRVLSEETKEKIRATKKLKFNV